LQRANDYRAGVTVSTNHVTWKNGLRAPTAGTAVPLDCNFPLATVLAEAAPVTAPADPSPLTAMRAQALADTRW
jgi:hypothetical protein